MYKFIYLILITFPCLVFSQEKDLPVSISLFNEATAIPFTKLFTTPIHPGIQVGTAFEYRSNPHTRLYQTANILYYYHQHLNQGIGLHSEIAWEYRTTSGLACTGLLGVGYLHTFATAEEFIFKNGQYENVPDRGNSRLYPSLSIEMGYYIYREQVKSPKIFIRYQAWAEYPFSPGFIPVMTHINFHAGYAFFISK